MTFVGIVAVMTGLIIMIMNSNEFGKVVTGLIILLVGSFLVWN